MSSGPLPSAPDPDESPRRSQRARSAAARIFGWAGWAKLGRAIAGVAAVGVAVAAVSGLWFTGQSLDATRGQYRLAEQSQVTERFSGAIDNLGSDKLDVRLGGIFLLERLARDSPADQGTVIDVLAAFLRTHSPYSSCPPPGTVVDGTDPEQRLPVDLQAAVTVIGRRDTDRDDGLEVDLVRTCLAGARLGGARLANANLSGGNLSGAQMQSAALTSAAMVNTDLSGAWLAVANLRGAQLSGARVVAANLSRADLTNAVLVGASLTRANLPAANLTGAHLNGADLTGANLADADLTDAQLDRAKLDGIFYSQKTVWPRGFTPPASRASP
ncbi:pentapeptide repeat-containing protein [Nocardia sp. NPDC051832]|uniref:pentapeptide repeat-containing protein n=1 Tax=Nocardia sp. NPDC051832 TaxID=3155673 RepID=UPI003443C913